MTLKELSIGETAVIKTVGGEGPLRQHFLDMGVIPGTQITLMKYAPMGDPMELMIHGYELTLRLDDAEKIEIVPEKEQTKSAAAESTKRRNTGVRTRERAVYIHPGLGEGGKRHVRSEEHPPPKRITADFRACRQSELRKNDSFYQLTGSNQHVGNFPGVTVDRKSGANPRTFRHKCNGPPRDIFTLSVQQ